jgi:hypothetical protein
LKISGKTGDIPDETIIPKDERPAGKAGLNGDEYIIPIDDKIVSTHLIG